MNPESVEQYESALQLLKQIQADYRRAREDLQEVSSRFGEREVAASLRFVTALDAMDRVGAGPDSRVTLRLGQEHQKLPFILARPVFLLATQQYRPTLEVYCLGKFQVRVGSKRIEHWRSTKAKSLLKYLITHHRRPIAKEVLMEALWPGCEPSLAKNNLKMAVYALRQTLNTAEDTSKSFDWLLVMDGNYMINPEVVIWVDLEQLEYHWVNIRKLEKKRELTEAIKEYEIAEALYKGDYLEEDLYAEWTSLRREALKDVYLAILAKLADHSIINEDYDGCIIYCQKILEKDQCREDTYRRLMNCYSRLGNRTSAIRWYHLCKKTIKRELGIIPDPQTTSLYHKLLNNERA